MSSYNLRGKKSPQKSPEKFESPRQRKKLKNVENKNCNTEDEDDSVDTSFEEIGSKSGNDTTNTSKEDEDQYCSDKHQKRNDNNNPKPTSSASWITNFLFLMVLFALMATIVHLAIEKQSSLSENKPDLIKQFNEQMKTLKKMFPTQTSRFWKVLKVSLRRIIVENQPEYPSVLLLVVPSGSKSSETGTCVAKHLTRTINTLFNVTSAKVINILKDITHSNPDAEKKDLDDQIRESFEKQQLHSIAFDHFEQLSPRASLLFHGYCDGDNAPFKNVAIVFVLHTDYDKNVLESDRNGQFIDSHLQDLWSRTSNPLDLDKIDPLIARVANNPAIVTDEKDLKCK